MQASQHVYLQSCLNALREHIDQPETECFWLYDTAKDFMHPAESGNFPGPRTILRRLWKSIVHLHQYQTHHNLKVNYKYDFDKLFGYGTPTGTNQYIEITDSDKNQILVIPSNNYLIQPVTFYRLYRQTSSGPGVSVCTGSKEYYQQILFSEFSPALGVEHIVLRGLSSFEHLKIQMLRKRNQKIFREIFSQHQIPIQVANNFSKKFF